MKTLTYILLSLSFFIFASCSSTKNHGEKECCSLKKAKKSEHSCCRAPSDQCKKGCKPDKSCCKDECKKCDGKSNCKDGSCDLPKKKKA